MELLQKFKTFITEQQLFTMQDVLLLAVSGGIDSVVLCELCAQLQIQFEIAHCNFQLRGEQSERDEDFVKKLGEKYGKPVHVKKFATGDYAIENKVSIQVAARELRYAWFYSLIEKKPGSLLTTPTYIVTGHHQDDNIETMLLNFFKGTGIAGLRGMLPRNDKVIRPLLFASKEAIKEFATSLQLNWVEDGSNASDKYSRNYFRNQLIPLVQKIYPAALDNLADNTRRFRDIELLYHQSIEQHKKSLLEIKGDEIHIAILKLKKSVPLNSIVFEIIKDYHFSAAQVNEVLRLLDSESGKFITSPTHRILKNRNWLIISPKQEAVSQHVLIESADGTILFEKGRLTLKQHPADNTTLSTDPSVAMLDSDMLDFPLLLRKWKQGDYFYPLGMAKKKKLARFFIDNRVAKSDKEKTWVLEMNKKIVWIVGSRIDNRFKITPQTKNILQIKVEVGVF